MRRGAGTSSAKSKQTGCLRLWPCFAVAILTLLLSWLHMHKRSSMLEHLLLELHGAKARTELTLGANSNVKTVTSPGITHAHSIPAWISPQAWMHADEITNRLATIFSALPKIADIQPNATVFLTFTNGHYSELMLNAVATIAALGHAAIVYCFDQQAVDVCEAYGIPHLQPEAARLMQTEDFRQNRAKFLEMGTHKPEVVLKLFEEYEVETVILVDTDTVWLRDPAPLLAAHPAADVFTTTDCLSFEADIYSWNSTPRCAHTAQGLTAPYHWGINSGVTAYRRRPRAIHFLQQWRAKMLDPEHARAGRDDQIAFNSILAGDAQRARGQLPLERNSVDARVFLAGTGAELPVTVLPSALFPGGKTLYDYHLDAKYGTHPYAIHATYQRYNNRGKRARFRESGAWWLDPTAYYAEGNFMSVRNNVHSFIHSLQQATSTPLQPLHLHLLAASYQHAVLRDAYAIARTLNRTLILPKLYVYCDWEPSPSVLINCTTPGSEGHVPYQSTSDIYVNIDVMDTTEYVPYRVYNFLDQPSVPQHVKWDKETVYLHWLGQDLPLRYDTGADVYMGFSDAQLRDQLSSFGDTRLLHFENLEPHSFAGFVQHKDNVDFEAFHAGMRWEQKWCCMTNDQRQKEQAHAHLFYLQPTPLTASPALPWPVPQYPVPDQCIPTHDVPLTGAADWGLHLLDLPNHPCNFLAHIPQLPLLWTPDVSLLTLPVIDSEPWQPFHRVPGSHRSGRLE